MPKPKANESRKDFMMRCIPMVIKEGKSREQAIAQCSATYANKDKYAKWRWWNTCCNHYWIDNIIAVGYNGNDFVNTEQIQNKKMSKEDLIPFKKGQSGNPNGRPKGSRNRSTIVKEVLQMLSKEDNPLTGQEEWLTNEQRMTISILLKALKGDVNAYKALMDSAYGTAKDTVDINSNEKRSIDFKHLISGIKAKQ